MNMLTSDNNVRNLFAELGLVPGNPEKPAALVIDHFDQWTDTTHGALRTTGFCGCGQPSFAELEAA
jgi:hypothetical protein